MHIQFNTDNNIEGKERLAGYFEPIVAESLKRFEDKVTGLEIHLGDENSDKFGTDDKRCSIEARIAGRQPVAAVHHADTIEKAVQGATSKIKKILETTFDKMRAH